MLWAKSSNEVAVPNHGTKSVQNNNPINKKLNVFFSPHQKNVSWINNKKNMPAQLFANMQRGPMCIYGVISLQAHA
jgi:hypothetical protein